MPKILNQFVSLTLAAALAVEPTTARQASARPNPAHARVSAGFFQGQALTLKLGQAFTFASTAPEIREEEGALVRGHLARQGTSEPPQWPDRIKIKTDEEALDAFRLFEKIVESGGMLNTSQGRRSDGAAGFEKAVKALPALITNFGHLLPVFTVTTIESLILGGILADDALESMSGALVRAMDKRPEYKSDSTMKAAAQLLHYQSTSEPRSPRETKIHAYGLRIIEQLAGKTKVLEDSRLRKDVKALLKEPIALGLAGRALVAIADRPDIPDTLVLLAKALSSPDLNSLDYVNLAYAVSRAASRSWFDATDELFTILERLLQREGLPDQMYFYLTLALYRMPVSTLQPGLTQALKMLPRPEGSGHPWPHYPIFSSRYLQHRTMGRRPGERFSIALDVYHLLKRYRRRSRWSPSLVRRTVDYVMAKREALGPRDVYGPGIRVINIIHNEMAGDVPGLVAFQKRAGSTVIQTRIGPRSKDDALDDIATARGKLTLHFDGHGGPDHFWLDHGTPGTEISKNLHRADAISYLELAIALQSYASHGDLNQVTILLDACYTSDLAARVLNELKRRGVRGEPLIDASSHYDAPSHYDKGVPNSSIFFKAMTSVTQDQTVQVSRLLAMVDFSYGHQVSILFMPEDLGEMQALFGPNTQLQPYEETEASVIADEELLPELEKRGAFQGTVNHAPGAPSWKQNRYTRVAA